MNSPASPRVIWLIRHGMREDFVDETWRETAERPQDPPLAEIGLTQASETAAFLSAQPIEAVYASPFLRTIETAGVISDALGCPIRIEHGLAEALKSAWFPAPPTFLDPPQLAARFARIDVHYQTKVRPDYPEEDEDADTGPRCARMVESVLKDDWTCIAMISHGAAVGQTAKALMGGPVDGLCCAMCGVNRFEWDGDRWRLTHAGTDHLSWSESMTRFH